jgi:hypothetical protein
VLSRAAPGGGRAPDGGGGLRISVACNATSGLGFMPHVLLANNAAPHEEEKHVRR